MSENEKRTGRPAKPPTQGSRVSLGLKVTPEIKRRLDSDARKHGRTQSQQAESMIELGYSIRDLHRVETTKNDLFLLQCEYAITQTNADLIKAGLQAALGYEARVLVLGGNFKLNIIGQPPPEKLKGEV